MTSNNYAKGRARELDLRHVLRREGIISTRSYKSAGGDLVSYQPNYEAIKQKLEKPVFPIDITAARRDIGLMYIQVSKYLSDISKVEFNELKRLAVLSGAIPILAYQKESRKIQHKKQTGWKFLNINFEQPLEIKLF